MVNINPNLDDLAKVAVIISGFATALSAIYLRKQNILSLRRESISILYNPFIWDNKNVLLKICNSSSYPVIIDSLSIINQISKNNKGELHEYIVETIKNDKDNYLKPNEIYEYNLNITNYPKNIPLSLEIRYKSSVDEFKEMRTLLSNENRTIV